MSLAPKKDRQIAHLNYLLKKEQQKTKSQQEFIQELIVDKKFLQIKIDKLCKKNNQK
jgi:hypothetical protein